LPVFVPPAYGQQPVSAARNRRRNSPAGTAEPASTKRKWAKGLVKIGAAAALTQAKPLEKNQGNIIVVEKLCSIDGTRVNRKINTSSESALSAQR